MSRRAILACLGLLCFFTGSAFAASKNVEKRAAEKYRSPDLQLDGFPLWLGADRKADRVVVLVEGFDLYNLTGPGEWLERLSPVVDPLLNSGLDVLVVDFPDSLESSDSLAPHLARAIRAGAAAVKQPVAVVGLSAGGITARWALAAAEESGEPLPVHTLYCVDTPHRGARLHPALQAMVAKYGNKLDQKAVASPALQTLISCVPKEVKWSKLGLPGLGRKVPRRWEEDSSRRATFHDRLTRLNGNRGYPKNCRLVAVSLGSRRREQHPGDLMHVWVPFGYDWTCKCDPADDAPGSVLPKLIASRFKVRMPLGLGGSYLRCAPTFIPTESALDAGPDETPPFHEWYARPDNAAPIAHDAPDEGAVTFLIGSLLKSFGDQPSRTVATP